MPKYENCIINPDGFPVFEAPDGSRRVTLLINEEICGASGVSAGLWWLNPGQQSELDFHPKSDELYYVVSGEGKLVLNEDEEYVVKKGMTAFVPAGVKHQTFNTGSDELCYYYVFSPPPTERGKVEEQNWIKIR